MDRVYPFFAEAWNLERITPPELCFHIVTQSPLGMAPGTLIDYRLHLFGLPLRWRTVISVWDPPHRFVDQQLAGPYARWIHLHQFREEEGQTSIQDTVRFELPFWPLGELLIPFVAMQLHRIFTYRQLKTWEILVGSKDPVPSSVRLSLFHPRGGLPDELSDSLEPRRVG